MLCLKIFKMNAGVGKSRLTAMSTKHSLFLFYYLLEAQRIKIMQGARSSQPWALQL